MNTATIGLGVDLEENKRFLGLDRVADRPFLEKIFTPQELDYCFSRPLPAQHLCARFAGKEAVIKALRQCGQAITSYQDIEISHAADGAPVVTLAHRPTVRITISLSHSAQQSAAFVLISL